MTVLSRDERVAMARLRALLELLPTALDRQIAGTGLTSFEYSLLEAIHDADGGRLRLTALASRTNATLPRLSRVVTGLERKGLVQRVACEEDARATNAVLTDQGSRAYRDGLPVYERAIRSTVLDGLGAADLQALADLSFTILSRLDPDRRLAITSDVPDPVAPSASDACPADPPTGCPADPATA